MLAVAAAVVVAITLAVGDARAWRIAPAAQLRGEVRTEINRVRAGYGFAPLRASGPLRQAAAQHVYEMSVLGYFSHGSPNRPSFADRLALYYPPLGNAPWQVGEVLLWWAPPMQARTVVQLWLDSPSHRRVLLDPRFREAGIAAVLAGPAGGVFGGRRVTLVAADFGFRG